MGDEERVVFVARGQIDFEWALKITTDGKRQQMHETKKTRSVIVLT